MKVSVGFVLVLLLWGCNSDPEVWPEKNNRLQVYPNPFSDVAYVSFDNPSGEAFKVVVFGTKGEVLFERNENITDAHYPINLSDEPRGTYHVILEMNGSTITRRVFKK